jgi:hypothetical protein
MKRIYILYTAAFIILIGNLVSAQTPLITALSDSTLPQAGRLKINGTNFGLSQGTGLVKIGGVNAPVSTWTATSITAYVADITPGVAQVKVFTAADSSNALPLNVTLRVPDGRVLWRFKADDLYIQGRPGIGPDGTIYALGISGHLYAITPEGGIKWIYNLNYGSVQSVSVSSDSTIYFSSLNKIYAVTPQDVLKWIVTDSSGALVDVGPTVGPDGNIYAVTSQGTGSWLGAMSISPQGQIIWNLTGFLHGSGNAGQTKEVVFGSGQLYFCMNNSITGNHGLQAITLSGNQMWTQLATGQPAVAPDSNISVITAYIPNSYAELGRFSPQGNLMNTYFGNGTTNLTYPDYGSDSVFYIGQNLSNFMAVNPSGSIGWQIVESGFLGSPIVNHSNNLVVAAGYEIGFPGYVAAVSTAGQPQWTVNLPAENGGFVRPMSRPRFSANDSVVYIGMDVNDGAADIYTYLYAIGTEAGTVNIQEISLGNLIQIYPNPAHSSATISFNLSETQYASISIIDIVGKEVKHITTKKLQPGNNRIILDLSALITGIYFCKIKSSENIQTIKLIKY